MGAPDLIEHLANLGVKLELADGKVRAMPRAALTGEVQAFIRSSKAELVLLLATDIDVAKREAFEERAAILEYDAGLPREEAERQARRRLIFNQTNQTVGI